MDKIKNFLRKQFHINVDDHDTKYEMMNPVNISDLEPISEICHFSSFIVHIKNPFSPNQSKNCRNCTKLFYPLEPYRKPVKNFKIIPVLKVSEWKNLHSFHAPKTHFSPITRAQVEKIAQKFVRLWSRPYQTLVQNFKSVALLEVP